MTVTIRRALPADARALAAVAAATFALACPPGTTQADIDDFIASTLSEERFVHYLADPERDIRLAIHDGVAAGYTMLVFGEPSNTDAAAAVTARPTVELSKVYVLGDRHGAGVAAPLMAATLEVARERQVASVWLGVNQHNSRAIRFYEKSGFSVVGTKTFVVGSELHHDHVMLSVL